MVSDGIAGANHSFFKQKRFGVIQTATIIFKTMI